MTSSADPVVLQRVALEAMTHVQNGMRLGLGTGRAAEAFIRELGGRVAQGLSVVGVATSIRSETLARELNIPLRSLDEIESLDIALDGADEVDPLLDLTKGLGGALLRERVVASSASKFIVMVTPDKLVKHLGDKAPIPIEVVPFALSSVMRRLAKLECTPSLRMVANAPYRTDNGNCIVDARFTAIASAYDVDNAIRRIPGVVDNGLFLKMADIVLVGEPSSVCILKRSFT